jgi:hypothetical protein
MGVDYLNERNVNVIELPPESTEETLGMQRMAVQVVEGVLITIQGEDP